jgi:hypothetical protein
MEYYLWSIMATSPRLFLFPFARLIYRTAFNYRKMLFVLDFFTIYYDFVRLQKYLTFWRCLTRKVLLVSMTLEGIFPLSFPAERKQVNKKREYQLTGIG